MDKRFYRDLQQDFVEVRHLHFKGGFDQDRFTAVTNRLRFARKEIAENSPKKEKEVLLYCIDTLFELFGENDPQKICDFADTVHNIPEVYLGSRSIYSFRQELNAFRKTYGGGYFADLHRLYPRLGFTPPKNAVTLFDPKADDDFKAAHPIGYRVLIGIGIVALLAPMAVYLLLMALNGMPENGWLLLGVAGCFIIGIGLFNIVAAFLHQYLGHIVTVGCLVVGGGLTVLSVWLVYKEMFAVFFAQPPVSAYLSSLFFLLVLAGAYGWFRHGVHLWLRRTRTVSETHIKKMKRGKANYWWYQQLHQEVGMGIVYWLNKGYTLWYAGVLLLALTTGFLRPMATVVCFLSVPLYIAAAGMAFFTQLEDHWHEHGRPVVLWARDSHRGRDSSLLDLLMSVLILLLGYTHIRIIAALWGILLPHL